MKDQKELACIARVNKWLSKKGKGVKKGRKQSIRVPPKDLLYGAASYGHSEAVKALLDAGADAEAKDANGYFALFIAAQKGHSDVVKIMLDAGADVEVKDSEGHTALYFATQEGHSAVVQLLINAGADKD
jgi:ankyrin repeat protein